jgi:RNA polymerase sigma-70 factor, ECF subfamily
MPFTEVADVLGRTPEATRQLASRARRRVRGASSPDHAADFARQREVATAFLAAARGGDMSALIALLDPDVTLHADAGASPAGRAVDRQGVRLVASGAAAASSRAAHSRLALVDGTVGLVFAPVGRLQIVIKLTVSADRKVTAMDVIADPDRLRGLRLAVLPD